MGQAGRFSLFIYCVEDERESALLHWRAPGSVTTLQIEMKAPRIPKPRKTNPLSRASVTDKENYLHKNVWCFWSPNFSGVQETGHSEGEVSDCIWFGFCSTCQHLQCGNIRHIVDWELELLQGTGNYRRNLLTILDVWLPSYFQLPKGTPSRSS